MEIVPKHLKSLSTVLIRFPFSGGQPRKGVEHGPEALVKAGLKEQLQTLGWEVEEDASISWDSVNALLGSDPDMGKMRNPRSVSKASELLAAVVEKQCKAGKLPLTIGGDHSLGTGSMIGTARAVSYTHLTLPTKA